MAQDTSKGSPGDAPGNTAVETGLQGDHDRVQMLSLRADGTPDQFAPEMIGDKETSVAATKEQFAQQAVSAHDYANRTAVSGAPVAEEVKQDPAIRELQEAQQRVDEQARSSAESVVEQLHQGDERGDRATGDLAAEQQGDRAAASKASTPPSTTAGNTAAAEQETGQPPVDKRSARK